MLSHSDELPIIPQHEAVRLTCCHGLGITAATSSCPNPLAYRQTYCKCRKGIISPQMVSYEGNDMSRHVKRDNFRQSRLYLSKLHQWSNRGFVESCIALPSATPPNLDPSTCDIHARIFPYSIVMMPFNAACHVSIHNVWVSLRRRCLNKPALLASPKPLINSTMPSLNRVTRGSASFQHRSYSHVGRVASVLVNNV